MRTAIRVAVSALVLSLGVDGLAARAPAPARERLIVLNSPSSASQGFDSVLSFNARGKGTVLLGVEQQRTGLRDIVCRPTKPFHLVVSQSDFWVKTSGFLILSRAGSLLHTLPAKNPGDQLSTAYDRNGALYTVDAATVYRDHAQLASLPPDLSIGRVAVDSRGNVYVTSPHSPSPRIFRIDPSGQVTVFADETQGLMNPYGIAIDGEDNVFVADTETVFFSSFILKFDPVGAPTMFANDLATNIRGMTFDADGDLYITQASVHTIVKFTRAGQQSIFADASDGLNFPFTIRACPF